MHALTINDLTIERDGTRIIGGFSLEVPAGEVHALMGPNGSGKSTLAGALAGRADHTIISGSVTMDGENLLALRVEERAKHGLFLSMQHPTEIPGVSLSSMLRAAVNARREKPVSVVEFHNDLKRQMAALGMDPAFAARGVNEGFSGGEKKRAEILQLAMLMPKYAILDETDSGLDVDALAVVTDGINRIRGTEEGKRMGILVITHYARILDRLNPDRVHVMQKGRIVKSGGPELAKEIESSGYAGFGDTTTDDTRI
jgi:Fe-S cluster assembly ATP-binding protein